MHVSLIVSMVFLTSTIGASELPLSGSDTNTYEEKIELESWMMEPDTWAIHPTDLILLEEDEQEIKLENWMYNPDNEFWAEIITAEKEFKLEAWMTSPWNWNEANQEQLLSFK